MALICLQNEWENLGSVSLHLASFPNGFRGILLSRMELGPWYYGTLCVKIGHLISHTNYATDVTVWEHHPQIYSIAKPDLESSPIVVNTHLTDEGPGSVVLLQALPTLKKCTFYITAGNNMSEINDQGVCLKPLLLFINFRAWSVPIMSGISWGGAFT